MKVITQSFIPPLIVQHFDRLLLSRPAPSLSESKEYLWRVYLYIKKKLLKPNSTRKRRKEVPDLEKEFLELYGQIEEKEKELKKQDKDPSKRLFYHIVVFDITHSAVFSRLKFRSWRL